MADKKKGNRYFVWIIMVLLFLGLLGFGGSGLSGNNRTIGSVGEKEITVQQYQLALDGQIRAFEAQIQQPIPFSQAQAFGIDATVRAQLVTERALDNEAAQLGISVGDERVREEVLRVPAFRGISGGFDREAYRLALQRTGQTESMFEQSIRDNSSRALLQGAVVGGIPAPTAYVDTLVQFIGEQRTVTWAAVDAGDLIAPLPGPTEADIAAFHDENPDLFTAPEQREITFAWLTPNMIQDTLDVPEASLREAYEARSAEFIRPERRLVERLVFLDDAAANAALARIEAGAATFEDLVDERGLDLSDTDMGDVTIEDLGSAADGVFAAAPTEVVGPFSTDLGPALFRMNAILAEQITTFEDAEDDLREELSADRARRQIETLAEDINDLMAGGATLEQLAETTQMELGTISYDSETFDGIAAYESFRIAAEAATEGAFPDLELLEDGGVFALRLDGLTPPAVRPLDDVRDAVAVAWAEQTERDAITARAEDIAGQITADSNINDTGLTAIAEPALTRRSFVAGTPPTFMTEVFEMQIGDVKVIPSTNNALIVRLEATAPPDAEDPQTIADRRTVGDTAAQGIAQDIFDAYNSALRAQTDVQLDQATINAIHAQFQ